MTDTMISGEEAIFWDRLQGMPWIEAEQELVLRRERLAAGHVRMSEKKEKALRVGNLSLARHIGREMDAANKTMTVLTERIKFYRKRQESAKWANAVKAIFGQDGFEACRVWMAQQEQSGGGA